jgi:tungstate transport system substrate-binding protein
MNRRARVGVLVAALAGLCVAAASAQGYTIRIYGTSDVTDSGLYANEIQSQYLASPFAAAGDALSYTAVGTGAALTDAENGLADIVIVHSPLLEKAFVTAGYSYEPLGRSLFYNNYVIVGPKSDPAGVATNDPNNAVGAYQAIAAQGANHANATFVSRNDASGTNTQEETMWGQTTGVPIQLAANRPAGNTTLYQPEGSGGAGTYPAWYARSGLTQGANVQATNTCVASLAPDGGCYTMTDAGTFQYLQQTNPSSVSNLKIVSQNNSASAPGGVTELVNPFHLYILNPAKTYPNGVTPNVAAATRLANFLTGATGASTQTGKMDYSPVFQNSLAGYLAPPQVFTASAFAALSATAPAKGTTVHVTPGHTYSVSATLSYAVPQAGGASAALISGMPYEFDESTNGGSTWSVIGTGTTGASGVASATTPALSSGQTMNIQLVMSTDDDSTLATQFSPNTNAVAFGTLKSP